MNLFFIILCLFGASFSFSSAQNPTVTYSQGTVIGFQTTSRGGSLFNFWLGIPYATFPQRFADPVASPTSGLFQNQTWWGAPCVQFPGTGGGIEQGCNTINVFAPVAANSTHTLPVMVYIYGGGFQTGASSSYYPQYFMDRPIVLVTFNYRLGPYGFLNANIPGARGNQGLKDQVLALKWVQQNIGAFGGNKNKVTIFGESAGAMSVSYHLVSPMSRGLFSGAIMQSGVFNSPFTYEKLDWMKCSIAIAQQVGCPTNNMTNMVACLQTANLTAYGNVANALSFSEAAIFCGPTIETFATGANDPHVFLDQDPWSMITTGNFTKVPVIIGTIGNTEMYYSSSGFVSNNANLAYLAANWDPVIIDVLYAAHNPTWFEMSQGALRQFIQGGNLLTDTNLYLDLSTLITDRLFTHPARVLGAQLTKAGVNVYMYNWTRATQGNPILYDAHASDLQYFFNVNNQYTIPASDIPLSTSLLTAWTNFATNGAPGQLWGGVNQAWAANTVNTPCGAINYATIDYTPSMATATNQSMSNCNFWLQQTINDPGDASTCPTLITAILNNPLLSGLGGLLGALLG